MFDYRRKFLHFLAHARSQALTRVMRDKFVTMSDAGGYMLAEAVLMLPIYD